MLRLLDRIDNYMRAYRNHLTSTGEWAMNREEVWQGQYAIETSATAEAIWSIFRDVAGWKTWNAGIEHIDIEGPFSAGTWFTMKPPGEDTLRSQLIEVRENECFLDETRLGSLVVTVSHRIERLGPTRTRIVYAVDASGPEASKIGPAVASDFPDVLASLAKLAEASHK
jgi:hypothetical protein